MSEDDFSKGMRKFQKRLTLSNNVMRGRMAESNFAMSQSFQGNEVRKINKGGDFEVQRRDFWGNKVGKPQIHEIKTGNSRLSEAQENRKRRLGRRFTVDRY